MGGAQLARPAERRRGRRRRAGRRRARRFSGRKFSLLSHPGGTGRRRDHPSRPHERHRSEEHTSELQSLMRISYAVFCLKKKKLTHNRTKATIRSKQSNQHLYKSTRTNTKIK